MWPASDARPDVGLIDATPQQCAGQRTLANVSVPMSSGDPPTATLAAAPPELPPTVRLKSNGLFVALTREMRFRWVWTTSSEETTLSRMAIASLVADQ